MADFHQLLCGFHHFREDYLLREREFFERLSKAQNPKTLVIACCDSRTDPALVTGARPGELFVVRSIAALVPSAEERLPRDAVMSAVEYAVMKLRVTDIAVMGHSDCGGVHGMLSPSGLGALPHVRNWIEPAAPLAAEMIREAPAASREALARRCEQAAVLLSVENLLSYPWLEERVRDGRLRLHALYYDMAAGHMCLWNPEAEAFEPSVRRRD